MFKTFRPEEEEGSLYLILPSLEAAIREKMGKKETLRKKEKRKKTSCLSTEKTRDKNTSKFKKSFLSLLTQVKHAGRL